MSKKAGASELAVNPQRMGVTFAGGKGTARVYSANASSVSFCILEPENPRIVQESLALSRVENDIWEVTSTKIKPGISYALRADGPEGPLHGFNPTLNLIDPYAKAVERLSAREYYCVATVDDFDWQGVDKPAVPLERTIIYEAHVRGLTRGNPDLPDDIRGTYAALGHPSIVKHLVDIGVTSVELLPIHMFISEPRLMNMGLINYWGYNSINFFTPQPRYATSAAREKGPEHVVAELKTAIRELHRAGIEVILDVVYNHTAEGGGGGLTYSYRGLDNASYYRLDERGWYQDTTGCGNSLNFANPHVVQLTMDSLRYWTEEMQIDGYRFDLATTLARDASNTFDPNHPILQAMASDPILSDAKLIMEPWDVGLGGWQTGNFPERFAEWNDRYRDSVRKFWLTDLADARNSGSYWNGVADLATRLSGSQDIVGGHGPLGSVNFITAHDGFCLKDLVSYNVKHNQVNGESNRDGTSNNYSFNFGVEGDTQDASIRAQRRKAARNLLATLMFSAGIPMVTAGDERGKTQLGNNNAYCQDSTLSWVNWDLSRPQQDLQASFSYLTKLRSENASLRPSKFGSWERLDVELDRIRWYNSMGGLMTNEDWNSSSTRTLQRVTEHLDETGAVNKTLLIVHGAEREIKLQLPQDAGLESYEVLWNSAHELPPTEYEVVSTAEPITVSGASVMLLRALANSA
jgi:glycogen operon protein